MPKGKNSTWATFPQKYTFKSVYLNWNNLTYACKQVSTNGKVIWDKWVQGFEPRSLTLMQGSSLRHTHELDMH